LVFIANYSECKEIELKIEDVLVELRKYDEETPIKLKLPTEEEVRVVEVKIGK